MLNDIITEHKERMLNLKKYYPFFKLMDVSFAQFQEGRYEMLDMGYIVMGILRFFIEENNFKEKDVTYPEYLDFITSLLKRDFGLNLSAQEYKELADYIFDKIKNEGRPFTFPYYDPIEKKKCISRIKVLESAIRDHTVWYSISSDAIEFYLDTKEIKEESRISVQQLLLEKMIQAQNFQGGKDVIVRINEEVARLQRRKNEIMELLGKDVFAGIEAYEDFVHTGMRWFDEEEKLFKKNKDFIEGALAKMEAEPVQSESYYRTLKEIYELDSQLQIAMTRHGQLLSACTQMQQMTEENGRQKRRKSYRGMEWSLFACGLGLLVFLFTPVSQGMKLTVLDVGQGDGIYLHTDSGYDIFIDGGSTNVQSVGKYRILPYLKSNGVKEIDYWFVSHTDLDHISGLLEIFDEGYRIRNLVLFRGMMRDESYEKLVSLAKEHGTEICMMSRKDTLFSGSAKITAISPEYHVGDEQRSEISTDKNGESLVLLYEEKGFSVLFTGDIGEEQEKQILKWGGINDIDFYKAAHHGSKYSNTKSFLDAVSPRISVISCAEKNRYGHPGRAAVENIRDTGSALFYTMEGGQITVTRLKKNELAVQKFLLPDKRFVFVR